MKIADKIIHAQLQLLPAVQARGTQNAAQAIKSATAKIRRKITSETSIADIKAAIFTELGLAS